MQEGIQMGPLINKESLEKVERHVRDALDKGAILKTGGEKVSHACGYFYLPTVLMNIDDSMLITREETFGPVAGITAFADEEEVIAKANATPYGLAGYYFTRDIGQVIRLAERLEFGILGANDGLPSTAQAPFGGLKESSLSREGSKYGLDEYLEVKYLSLGGI